MRENTCKKKKNVLLKNNKYSFSIVVCTLRFKYSMNRITFMYDLNRSGVREKSQTARIEEEIEIKKKEKNKHLNRNGNVTYILVSSNVQR